MDPTFQAYGLIGGQIMPTNNYNIMKVIYFIRGQSIKEGHREDVLHSSNSSYKTLAIILIL